MIDTILTLGGPALRGYVVRTTDHRVFALFGAPVACEDHPQRALYAALLTQPELRTHRQDQAARGRQTLDERVRVHTGEVVAYAGEAERQVEYRLIGHMANLANWLADASRTFGRCATTVATLARFAVKNR